MVAFSQTNLIQHSVTAGLQIIAIIITRSM